MAGTAGEPTCVEDAPGWLAVDLSFFVGPGNTIVEGTPEESLVFIVEPDCSEVGTENPVV